jgi:hypothetical protein
LYVAIKVDTSHSGDLVVQETEDDSHSGDLYVLVSANDVFHFGDLYVQSFSDSSHAGDLVIFSPVFTGPTLEFEGFRIKLNDNGDSSTSITIHTV